MILGPDAPPLRFEQAAADVEPQAVAVGRLRVAAVGAMKFLEDALMIDARNARAAILNPQDQPLSVVELRMDREFLKNRLYELERGCVAFMLIGAGGSPQCG